MIDGRKKMCLGIKNRLLIFISIIFCSYYLRHFTPPCFFFHNSFCELLTQIFSFFFFLDDYNDKQNTLCVLPVYIYSKSLVNKLVINSFAILRVNNLLCVCSCVRLSVVDSDMKYEKLIIYCTHTRVCKSRQRRKL